MMTTIKVTKLIIRHIENIMVNDVQEQIKEEYSDRTIFIQTHEGNRYEITLQAYTPDELEFEENDWLNPRVYKGEEE